VGVLGKNSGKIFGVIIIAGFGIVVFALLETPFPDLIPLTFVREAFGCDPNAVFGNEIITGIFDCRFFLGSFRTSQLPITHTIPLSIVDTKSPIILDYDFNPTETCTPSCNPPVTPACLSFVTDVVRLSVTDENGTLITTAMETAIDLQPLLLPDQRTLLINFDSGGIGVSLN